MVEGFVPRGNVRVWHAADLRNVHGEEKVCWVPQMLRFNDLLTIEGIALKDVQLARHHVTDRKPSIYSIWRSPDRRQVFEEFQRLQGKARFDVGKLLAKGEQSLLGRFMGYAASSHGGDIELKLRLECARQAGAPEPLYQVSVLQIVDIGQSVENIEQIEALWKTRLLTRHPFGLNRN